MADEQWKSKELENLGVKNAAIIEHGGQASRCSAALAASLMVALAGGSPQAAAQVERSDTVKVVAEHAVYGEGTLSDKAVAALGVLTNPQQNAVEMVGKATVGAAVAGMTNDPEAGKFAATTTGNLISLSAGPTIAAGVLGTGGLAAPVAVAYVLYDQGRETYSYLQAREEAQIAGRVADTAARTAQVQVDYIAKMRVEDRYARAAAPDAVRELDQKAMLKMAKEDFDVGIVSPALQKRLEVEEACVGAGLPAEPWFDEFQKYKAQGGADGASVDKDNDPSQYHGSLMDAPGRQSQLEAGLERMNGYGGSGQDQSVQNANSLAMR